jgi:hypothetical protein
MGMFCRVAAQASDAASTSGFCAFGGEHVKTTFANFIDLGKYFIFRFAVPENIKLSNVTQFGRPKYCNRTIKSIVKFSGKNQSITKIIGVSRVYELALILKNPYVLYIGRAPKAVEMSYYIQS